jgi:tyrosyl-DNA phosphodiesterase 2
MNKNINTIIKQAKRVSTLKFDANSNTWLQVTENNNIFPNKELSFITYNVWFESHNWKNRLIALGNIFQTYNPDIMCLQEVTLDFLKYILTLDHIKQSYYISNNFKDGYDVLILSKYNVSFYEFEFESFMGRKLLYAELPVQLSTGSVETIIISTAHLESMNNYDLRKTQLLSSFEILENYSLAFFMGDFNFSSDWKEQAFIEDSGFSDSWDIYRKFNGLYEMDGVTMLKSKHFPAWRPDRLLFRSKIDDCIKFKAFEIIGRDVIAQKDNYSEIYTPSDHFGLFGSFIIN